MAMKLNRTIITYIILTIGALLFDRTYSLFAHGVSSPWMSNMYLYLLGLGVLVFLLFKIFVPDIVTQKGYRLFFNTYNSGIAVLITGMLQKGILDIAGSSSQFVPWFFYTAYVFIAAAIVMFFALIRRIALKASSSVQDKSR